jgi:hypothetical protein
MKRFNLHTPVANVQVQIWQKKKKTCNMNTKKQYVIIIQALRKEK